MHIDRVIAASLEEERQAILTTAQCARFLGVTPAFIRGEIQDKRLSARVYKPETKRRAVYTIEQQDFTAYVERFWPKAG